MEQQRLKKAMSELALVLHSHLFAHRYVCSLFMHVCILKETGMRDGLCSLSDGTETLQRLALLMLWSIEVSSGTQEMETEGWGEHAFLNKEAEDGGSTDAVLSVGKRQQSAVSTA